MIPATLEKLLGHWDVDLDRAVVYLAVVASELVVPMLPVDVSSRGILVVVDGLPILVILSWNDDVRFSLGMNVGIVVVFLEVSSV